MAVVTNPLKNLVVDLLLDEHDSAAFLKRARGGSYDSGDFKRNIRYYAAIGRSQVWNDSDISPTAQPTLQEENRFRNNMQSVKLIADVSLVVPRYNWSSGTFYDAYDDATSTNTNAYYVINSNQQVYLVMRKSINDSGTPVASTVEPTGGTNGVPFLTSDGYMWKFMYSVSATQANKFQSANFIPIKFVDSTDGNSPVSDTEQKTVQDTSVHGEIVGYAIDNPGAGYSSAPTLTITGNGSNAVASATVSGGQVVKVEVADSTTGTIKVANFGSGYDYAAVAVSGGSPTTAAVIRPILAPNGGLGDNPVKTLRTNSIMLNSKPSGTEAGASGLDFLVDQDFRQVGLLKNPGDSAHSNDSAGVFTKFTENTGSTLRRLHFSSISPAFSKDDTILGATSGAKALVDKDSGNDIFYHQTDSTGFGTFTAGETVNATTGTGSGVLLGAGLFDSEGEVNRYSGELLYIDNRAKVERSADQTEDLKIIIQI